MAGVRVVGVSLLAAALAWSAAPPGNPPASVIARWVEDLGSEDFHRREEASRRLGQLDVVPEALVRATRAEDLEVRRRAERALRQVRENAVDKDLDRWQRRADAIGVDLMLDAIALGKAATEKGQWLAVVRLARRLCERANALGWRAATPADQDFLALPEQASLPLMGASNARVRIDRPDDSLVNVLKGCLVVASGPVGGINALENSVLLVSGDIESINVARHSLIVCGGTIGSLNVTEGCVVVARGVEQHNHSKDTLFEVERLGRASESENNLYVNRKAAAADKSAGDRFRPGVEGLWGQLRWFDLSRQGLSVSATAGGVRIDRVEASGAFARAGLRPGDRVRTVGGAAVKEVEALRRSLRRALAIGAARVDVERGGKAVRLGVRLD